MTYQPVPVEKRCQGRSASDFFPFSAPCCNRAKVTEEGKRYCHIHAPSVIAQKAAKRRAVWETAYILKQHKEAEQEMVRREQERRAALYPDLLAVAKLALRLLDGLSAEAGVVMVYRHPVEMAQIRAIIIQAEGVKP